MVGPGHGPEFQRICPVAMAAQGTGTGQLAAKISTAGRRIEQPAILPSQAIDVVAAGLNPIAHPIKTATMWNFD